MIDGRCRIAGCENLVRAAVAICARRARRRTGLRGLCVHRPHVGLLLGLVASGAGDLLGRVVRQARDVGVAVDTAEKPAMERVLYLGLVNKEADLLAVFFGGQGGIP